MTWFRRASFIICSIVLGAGLYSAPAQAADPLPVFGGGMKVTTDGGGWCSMGSVGYDDLGRAVGLIAGHCQHKVGDPVFLCQDQKQHEPPNCGGRLVKVGKYSPTSISSGYDTATNQVVDWSLDYAVIELDTSAVQLTNKTPNGLTINKIGPVPKVFDFACKDGKRTGKSCMPLTQVKDNVYSAWGLAWFGDSGSPLVVGDGLVGFTSTINPTNVIGPVAWSGVHGALADIASHGPTTVGIGFEPYTPA